MQIKRLVHCAAAFTLAAVLLASTSLACGWHHRRVSSEVRYALCSVEGCETVGRHTHDGITYCGYAHASGFCDGTCAALCSAEDCQITGRHTHDGVTYCGSAHEGCFCDGTCAAVSNTARGFHRHHGRHC